MKRPSIQQLQAERAQLKAYLLVKYDAEDWHAVMDASADLREIDTALNVIEYLLESKESLKVTV